MLAPALGTYPDTDDHGESPTLARAVVGLALGFVAGALAALVVPRRHEPSRPPEPVDTPTPDPRLLTKPSDASETATSRATFPWPLVLLVPPGGPRQACPAES